MEREPLEEIVQIPRPDDAETFVDDWPSDKPGIHWSGALGPTPLAQFEEPFDHFLATFALPVHLRLRRDIALKVPVGKEHCLAIFERKQSLRLHERSQIESARGMEFPNDPRGELVYSLADIKMPIACILERVGAAALDDLGKDACYEVASTMALEVVNQILIAYRHLAGAFHVAPVGNGDLSNFSVSLELANGRGGGRHHLFDRKPGVTLVQPLMERSFHERLQDWLWSNCTPDIVDELEISAQGLLDQGNYRMAVIDARTALEIALDRALMEALVRSPSPEEDVAHVLSVSGKRSVGLREILSRATIKRKLTRGAEAYLGRTLLPKPLDDEWRLAKSLREGAVHYGESVEEGDATLAIQAMFRISDGIRELRTIAHAAR